MSIKKHIKIVEYDIYLFTSHKKEYYTNKKINILKKLNVKLVYINHFNKKHTLDMKYLTMKIILENL